MKSKVIGVSAWLCFSAAILAFATTGNAAFIAYNGHFYGLTASGSNGGYLTWIAAEAEAQSLGGHLVTINDAAENTFLVNNFITAATGSSSRPLWIGFTDQLVEGTFVWSSGAAVTYTNWNGATGEPNDYAPEGGEDYGVIGWHFAQGSTSDRSTWNDTPLAGNTMFGNANGLFNDGFQGYRGIIELDTNPNPVPEPSSFVLALCGGLGLFGYRCRKKSTAA